MRPVETGKRTTGTGYEYEVTIYQAENCCRCPLRGACHKQKDNRKIEVNKKLYRYKQKARENLMSEIGKELRGRRNSEVEQTFGQLKWNKGFKRFLLRGLPKISIEIGLLALAHNFQKLSKSLNNSNLITIFEQISELYNPILNKIRLSIEKLFLVKLKNHSNKKIYANFEKIKKAA